jgi:hypothetical protein
MLYRFLPVVLAALALALFLCQPAFAAEKVHEGKIVKAGDGKLTMTDKDGKNKHTHDIPADTKITCDGKECKLDDLKEGFSVKVTTKDDGKTVARVEAKSKDKDKK